MGVKLIILLALLVGVLYCLHLLVKDYQALSAPRLLRFLFKRDLSLRNQTKPHVRWKKILLHDPLHCARVFYCGVGAGAGASEDIRQGFTYMISLEPQEEDKTSHQLYLTAYNQGRLSKDLSYCRATNPMCPFSAQILSELVQYMLKTNI